MTISSGIPELDVLLDGGYSRRRITQIYATGGAGTTLHALMAAAGVCRDGGRVAYIDWDYSLTPERIEQLCIPVGTGAFTYYCPGNLEEGVQNAILEMENCDLVVLDKCGIALTRAPADPSEPQMAATARSWANSVPLLASRAHRTNTAVIGIHTIRRETDLPRYTSWNQISYQAIYIQRSLHIHESNLSYVTELRKSRSGITGGTASYFVVDNTPVPIPQISRFELLFGED